jgi:hypothetical protein
MNGPTDIEIAGWIGWTCRRAAIARALGMPRLAKRLIVDATMGLLCLDRHAELLLVFEDAPPPRMPKGVGGRGGDDGPQCG